MSDDRPAVMNEGWVPLYTQVRGAEISIGDYGVATNTSACYVPESVAVELAPDKTFGASPLAPNAAEAPIPAFDEEAAILESIEEDEPEKPRRRERRGKE